MSPMPCPSIGPKLFRLEQNILNMDQTGQFSGARPFYGPVQNSRSNYFWFGFYVLKIDENNF